MERKKDQNSRRHYYGKNGEAYGKSDLQSERDSADLPPDASGTFLPEDRMDQGRRPEAVIKLVSAATRKKQPPAPGYSGAGGFFCLCQLSTTKKKDLPCGRSFFTKC